MGEGVTQNPPDLGDSAVPQGAREFKETKGRNETASRFPQKWSPAKRVTFEWRGLPEDIRPDRAISIGDVLGKLLPKLGLDTRIKEADIMAAWKGIVGDFIAQHSKPERLVAGTLMIRVIQPSVRYELDRTWKPQIIAKLREQFGEKMIRDIKFIL